MKILSFFPDFPRLQGLVGGSDQIWKIPDFFEPFPYPIIFSPPYSSLFALKPLGEIRPSKGNLIVIKSDKTGYY